MAVLSDAELRQYAANAGFTGGGLDTIVAIAKAESGGNPAAVGDQGRSFGLLQFFQPAHPGTQAQASDPQGAFNLGYVTSKGGTNFGAWSTYNNGAYQQFMTSSSNLIDGVIQAGSAVGVQCLQWVSNVTHGGGAGYGTAGGLELAAQGKGILQSTPSLGDIAVWAPNSNGAGGSGHAGLVTGLGSGGAVAVTGTNWPGGQGATQYIVGKGNNTVGMGAPSGYIHPGDVGGTNILGGASNPLSASHLGTTDTSTPNVETASGISGGMQRIGWTAAGLGLIVLGLVLVFRRDIPSVLGAPGAALAKVAK